MCTADLDERTQRLVRAANTTKTTTTTTTTTTTATTTTTTTTTTSTQSFFSKHDNRLNGKHCSGAQTIEVRTHLAVDTLEVPKEDHNGWP